ncbi:hypothetical protein K435DRAFT_958981 [Dendrothele bispora CBS 962.96]|uniref:Uncharacterized protein n=1 Tax=Dendrothele bispora (strain CBS 962.96) TaxID=1314807 RepID=A0A4S8MY84_DENBC|nr:hypothetical protein K435DRAFT_958981 [Dendrothele bispora CBS 962.96]
MSTILLADGPEVTYTTGQWEPSPTDRGAFWTNGSSGSTAKFTVTGTEIEVYGSVASNSEKLFESCLALDVTFAVDSANPITKHFEHRELPRSNVLFFSASFPSPHDFHTLVITSQAEKEGCLLILNSIVVHNSTVSSLLSPTDRQDHGRLIHSAIPSSPNFDNVPQSMSSMAFSTPFLFTMTSSSSIYTLATTSSSAPGEYFSPTSTLVSFSPEPSWSPGSTNKASRGDKVVTIVLSSVSIVLLLCGLVLLRYRRQKRLKACVVNHDSSPPSTRRTSSLASSHGDIESSPISPPTPTSSSILTFNSSHVTVSRASATVVSSDTSCKGSIEKKGRAVDAATHSSGVDSEASNEDISDSRTTLTI